MYKSFKVESQLKLLYIRSIRIRHILEDTKVLKNLIQDFRMA